MKRYQFKVTTDTIKDNIPHQFVRAWSGMNEESARRSLLDSYYKASKEIRVRKIELLPWPNDPSEQPLLD